MKVTEVTYESLRVTKAYENDRASVTIELDKFDDPQSALAAARVQCELALEAGRTDLEAQVKMLLKTPGGRYKLQQAVKEIK